MIDVQHIYFNEISKEEALKLWEKKGLYLLHDDHTESLIEEKTEIENTKERIGYEVSKEEIFMRENKAYISLYNQLSQAREQLDKKEEVDSILREVMEAISYIEALGF